eukprot:5334724-Pleurochrysis_carterae.AAC.3
MRAGRWNGWAAAVVHESTRRNLAASQRQAVTVEVSSERRTRNGERFSGQPRRKRQKKRRRGNGLSVGSQEEGETRRESRREVRGRRVAKVGKEN